MRTCIKCQKLTLVWNYPSKSYFCVNPRCTFLAIEIYATGCYAACWEFFLGGDGEFYVDWDGQGLGSWASKGYSDNKSIREAAVQMRERGVNPDLIEIFLQKCLRAEEKNA